MKYKSKILSIILLLFGLIHCDEFHDFLFKEIGGSSKKENTKPKQKELTPLDTLFINGFKMELEQVFIMSKTNTDEYVDYCFKDGTEVVNLLNFETVDYTNNGFLLYDLTKGMEWVVSEMIKTPCGYDIENGYSSTYFVVEYADSTSNNIIHVKPDITLITQYSLDRSIYTHRNKDNRILPIKKYNNNKKQEDTNLLFEIIKEFDKKYLWLQTNDIFSISYSLTAPLTGEQVKREIRKGNFELYLFRGLTTYKIGNNLYIPTRGDTYTYFYTINSNGMINNYHNLYYRLKFKILN
jgi:hypothetical protein